LPSGGWPPPCPAPRIAGPGAPWPARRRSEERQAPPCPHGLGEDLVRAGQHSIRGSARLLTGREPRCSPGPWSVPRAQLHGLCWTPSTRTTLQTALAHQRQDLGGVAFSSSGVPQFRATRWMTATATGPRRTPEAARAGARLAGGSRNLLAQEQFCFRPPTNSTTRWATRWHHRLTMTCSRVPRLMAATIRASRAGVISTAAPGVQPWPVSRPPRRVGQHVVHQQATGLTRPGVPWLHTRSAQCT